MGGSAEVVGADVEPPHPAVPLHARLVEGARHRRDVASVLLEQVDQLLPPPRVLGRERDRGRGFGGAQVEQRRLGLVPRLRGGALHALRQVGPGGGAPLSPPPPPPASCPPPP